MKAVASKSTVGKGENAGYQHLLFLQRFQKNPRLQVVKIRGCLVKG